jgi:hypothetical protein
MPTRCSSILPFTHSDKQAALIVEDIHVRCIAMSAADETIAEVANILVGPRGRYGGDVSVR